MPQAVAVRVSRGDKELSSLPGGYEREDKGLRGHVMLCGKSAPCCAHVRWLHLHLVRRAPNLLPREEARGGDEGRGSVGAAYTVEEEGEVGDGADVACVVSVVQLHHQRQWGVTVKDVGHTSQTSTGVELIQN